MKRLLLVSAYTLSTLLATGQSFETDNYDWKEARYDSVSVHEQSDVFVLLKKYVYQYYYEENGQLSCNSVFHVKLALFSDDVIGQFNKIYISQSQNYNQVTNFKARVINPNGELRELKKDEVQTGSDPDSETEYVYAAFEGLEKGSQLEYFYVKKTAPPLNGLMIDVEDYHPIERLEIDVVSPENLVFLSKVYNCDTLSFQEDTTLQKQRRIFLELDNIEPVDDELVAFRNASLVKVNFKLDQNLAMHVKNITTYSNSTQKVVNVINADLKRSEDKALQEIAKHIRNSVPKNEEVDSRTIENYLKSNFTYVEVATPELEEIDRILKNKAYNFQGGVILFTRMLKYFDIDYKMVYTTDRSQRRFDPDFHTENSLSNLLLYINSEDDYIDFTEPFSRLGFVSPLLRADLGLFIEETYLGQNIVGMGYVDSILAKPYDFTVDSLNLHVDFASDIMGGTVKVRRVLSGYSALSYQPYFEVISDTDDLKTFKESLLKFFNPEGEVLSIQVENGNAASLGLPLVTTGELKSKNIVEKAGEDYLFKVGTLIGEQVEMYQEDDERTMDVDSEFGRKYYREIHFDVPDGFDVSGLEALQMDVAMEYNGGVSAAFTSDYTRQENHVTVVIKEFYKELWYPKDQFESYRKVINAAADLNKKTVLLKRL